MHWTLLAVIALALSFAVPIVSVSQETTPSAQAAPSQAVPSKNGGAKPQTSGTIRNSSGAPKSDTAKVNPQKTPRKIVVREGGASEPTAQIVTGMSADEANRQRQESEKWLTSAEENLNRLDGRTLDAQQQETVSQIHNYVGGARSALKEGDISRGHTLALKASLLAEDLVKH